MADRWAQFLDHLAGAIDAGIALPQAVALAGEAAGGPLAGAAPGWARALEQGRPLAATIASADPLLGAILAAGERSGRLPVLARMVARQRQLLDRLRRQAIGRCVYPLLLLHAAVVLPAVVATVAGASPLWILAGPGAIWGLIAAGVLIWRWDRGRSRWWLRGPAGLVWWPLITVRGATALAAATAAGLLADASVELMADACGHPAVAARLRSAAPSLRQGRGRISTACAEAGFPAWAHAPLATAETAGRLEAVAEQVAAEAAFRFEERSTWAMRLATGAVYAVAMATAVAAILGIAMGYVRLLEGIARDAGM